MKKSVFVIAFLCFAFSSFSQMYMTAGGLRMGTDWGITIQQRVLDKVSVEAILQSSLQREEVLFTGLVERHYPIISKGFNIYTGGGIHKGWSNTTEGEVAIEDPFGVTFVMGAEMTLGRFNISYDFKPALNVSGGEKSFYTQTGVSLRYVLVKNKVYKNMKKSQKKKKRKKNRGDKEWWEVWKKS